MRGGNLALRLCLFIPTVRAPAMTGRLLFAGSRELGLGWLTSFACGADSPKNVTKTGIPALQ